MSSRAGSTGLNVHYYTEYYFAYSVLLGIELLVVLPFAFLCLIKNKSSKDAARRFVPWLKVTFWVFSL